MDIQQFLTLVINTFVLTSIIFFLLDFSFFLLDVWQQLSPSPQTDFYASCSSTETAKTALAYQQVKDAFWDDDTRLTTSPT